MNTYSLILQSYNLKADHVKNLAPILKMNFMEHINETAFRFKNVDYKYYIKNNIISLAKKKAIDAAFVPNSYNLRNYKILAMDMDSTLINIECIDEIARSLGLELEVSEITNAAMNGKIKNFQESLKRRVQLLQGGTLDILDKIYQERLQLNPGAEKLILSVQNIGIKTLLISSGFTFFAERLNEIFKFDAFYANKLKIQDKKITGEIEGPILDGEAKARYLLDFAKKHDVLPEEIIAIGDGANDIRMLECAGFSVAYCAKPVVCNTAKYSINFSGLDGVLNLLHPII